MTKRFDGKKMLGCWASPNLLRAILEWRQRPANVGKTNTDFLLVAAMEKLDAEQIPYDRALVLQDGRSKLDLSKAQPVSYSDPVPPPKAQAKKASSAGCRKSESDVVALGQAIVDLTPEPPRENVGPRPAGEPASSGAISSRGSPKKKSK